MLSRSSINNHFSIVLLAAVVVTATIDASTTSAQQAGDSGPPRTNVILIVTDNHGAWTLGCYGNPDIKTPNLDRMASEGVRFTRAFSNNPVCSPTRATLLSGLMPSQHGVHNYLNARYNTLQEFETLPDILSRAGYSCGIVGKWHLGPFDRPGQEGFAHWVVKQGGHTASFYNTSVIEDTGEKRRIEPHITPFWTKHAVSFIEKHKAGPFFLYLAYNGPYGLHTCINGEPKNRHAATYAGNEMKSYPREPMHSWLRTNREHIGNASSMRNYASQVSLVDDGVGEVLATLENHGLDQNTLVIFTADQGMAGGHGGFWGMGDHTRPRTIYDWTLHIPLIVRQPGTVTAGETVDDLVANYDILPTVLNCVGLTDQIPGNPRGPGHDFSPKLRGDKTEWENMVFGEYGASLRMVRTDHWKYIERADDGPWQLFHLLTDPDEKINLHDSPEHTEIQSTLRQRLHQFFATYSEPKWNLWKPGGTSKHLHTKERPQWPK